MLQCVSHSMIQEIILNDAKLLHFLRNHVTLRSVEAFFRKRTVHCAEVSRTLMLQHVILPRRLRRCSPDRDSARNPRSCRRSAGNKTDLRKTAAACIISAKIKQTPKVQCDSGQSFTMPSSEAEASLLPSGDQSTLTTQAVCPANAAMHRPIVASHSRTVPSKPPDASQLWKLVLLHQETE